MAQITFLFLCLATATRRKICYIFSAQKELIPSARADIATDL